MIFVPLTGDSGIARCPRFARVDRLEIINRGDWGESLGQMERCIERDPTALKPDLIVIQSGGRIARKLNENILSIASTAVGCAGSS